VSIGTLLIRADANTTIGTGHVMRCLALAQAWQDAGGHAVFAMAEDTEAIRSRIRSEHFGTFCMSAAIGNSDDLLQTSALSKQQNCEWIAVDGYQFGADYQRGLKAAGFKVLFLDDFGHSDHYTADVVLNQNVSATPALYSDREEQTRLVLGPRYALLRREFKVWNSWQRASPAVCRHVLVTMGGSDSANVTATAIKALDIGYLGEIEATVIVGGSNPNLEKLQDMVSASRRKIKLLKDVSNVGELMAAADVAISAAGTTCWELCLLALPALLIDVADNQTALAEELHKRGCAIHLASRAATPEKIAQTLQSLVESRERRQLLSKASRELVDGKGAMRVVSVLRGGKILGLRPLRSGDRRLLWQWANDVEVRAASFSTDPISWETHTAWFDERLRASQSSAAQNIILIAEDEEANPVGQIRFDARPDGDWEVDVSLAKSMRGRGLGSVLIESGLRELVVMGGRTRVHALVKPENLASVRSFERAAFRNAGVHQVRGHDAIHLVFERNSTSA
jgi:UDP-2,4-diacetamido-2,4,6-trideoxy-beta-L-altropyranose hydrolase